MSRPPYNPQNMVRHAPKVVISRDRAHLDHGSPLCSAPGGPGKTTSVDAYVNCDECLRLMEEDK